MFPWLVPLRCITEQTNTFWAKEIRLRIWKSLQKLGIRTSWQLHILVQQKWVERRIQLINGWEIKPIQESCRCGGLHLILAWGVEVDSHFGNIVVNYQAWKRKATSAAVPSINDSTCSRYSKDGILCFSHKYSCNVRTAAVSKQICMTSAHNYSIFHQIYNC